MNFQEIAAITTVAATSATARGTLTGLPAEPDGAVSTMIG